MKKQLKVLLDELVSTVCNESIIGYMDRDDKLILVMSQVPLLLQEAWRELCRPPQKTFERAMFEEAGDREFDPPEYLEIYPNVQSLAKVILCVPALREDAWSLLLPRCLETPKEEHDDIAYTCLKEQLVEAMKIVPEFRPRIWNLLSVLFSRLLACGHVITVSSSITDCCINAMIHCPEFAQPAWETILRYAGGEDFLKVMRLVPSFRQHAWDKLVSLKDQQNKDYDFQVVAEEFPEFRQKANELRAQLDPIIQEMVRLSKESV